MSTITINGEPYDFSFDFDLGDLAIFKKIAGITASSVDDIDMADPDMLVAVVMIAKRQAGSPITREEAERVKVSEIQWSTDDEPEIPAEGDEQLPPSDAAGAAARNARVGSRVTTLKAAGVRD